jgi:HSP20 family protein
MRDSFFEKLKKGMGIEIPSEEKEEKIERRVKAKKTPKESKLPTGQATMKKERELEPEARSIEPKVEESYSVPAPIEIAKGKKAPEKEEEEIEIKKPSFFKTMEGREETWLEPVGQLAVDVYQTEVELVIQSAIAGVRPEDLDISIEKDIVTISGERKKPLEEKGDYFSQECYWGKFSKQIILPVEIDPNKIEATLKDGILTIRAPKLFKEKKRRIMVRG